MNFGQSFPLDPLPSGWRHRKFWTRSPVSMAYAIKDGVPSMRFETHDSASMLFRDVDIDLAAYPMLAWRWCSASGDMSTQTVDMQESEPCESRSKTELLSHHPERLVRGVVQPGQPLASRRSSRLR
jgi:hypothetical protein